jgi:hypothetical protein
MESTKDATAFLHTFWLVTIMVFLGVGAFNALVDPFGIFGASPTPGFNQLKPELGSHARMAKAFNIRLMQPQGIILGSSRAEVGLDPEHPGWNEQSHPVYNLALSSARIDEVLDYLLHAQAHGPLREVVLSLDFFMFNANWRHEADFDAGRLSSPEHFFSNAGWLQDPIKALFSLDGLKASMDTIKAQDNPATTSSYANGTRDTRRKWTAIQSMGGHRQAFLANTHHELTHADGWPLFSLYDSTGSPSPLETFNKINEFCQQHNINLRVFISPLHALKQEVIWQLGLGPEFEHWKRGLVEILNNSDTTLWDFSGYNSITMEPFPPLGDDKTQMKNYWEGSHYRKHVGDLILDRLFPFQKPGRNIPDDFGVLLDSSNIDAHLLTTRKAREHYISMYQQDVEEIAQLVQGTEPERRAFTTSDASGQEDSQ